MRMSTRSGTLLSLRRRSVCNWRILLQRSLRGSMRFVNDVVGASSIRLDSLSNVTSAMQHFVLQPHPPPIFRKSSPSYSSAGVYVRARNDWVWFNFLSAT